jgi:hypothetical protein
VTHLVKRERPGRSLYGEVRFYYELVNEERRAVNHDRRLWGRDGRRCSARQWRRLQRILRVARKQAAAGKFVRREL